MTLQEKLNALTTLDEEIHELVTEEEVEEKTGHADVFKEKVPLAISNTDSIIPAPHTHTPSLNCDRSATPPPPTTMRVTQSLSTHTHAEIHSGGLLPPTSHPLEDLLRGPHVCTTRVNLPKLILKKFNRDLTRWTIFWDSFEFSIDQNPGLSEVYGFNYLNSCWKVLPQKPY